MCITFTLSKVELIEIDLISDAFVFIIFSNTAHRQVTALLEKFLQNVLTHLSLIFFDFSFWFVLVLTRVSLSCAAHIVRILLCHCLLNTQIQNEQNKTVITSRLDQLTCQNIHFELDCPILNS